METTIETNGLTESQIKRLAFINNQLDTSTPNESLQQFVKTETAGICVVDDPDCEACQ